MGLGNDNFVCTGSEFKVFKSLPYKGLIPIRNIKS